MGLYLGFLQKLLLVVGGLPDVSGTQLERLIDTIWVATIPIARMNPATTQLEAFIARLDRQRAQIELSLMDATRPPQEQEALGRTYDLLIELRQIAATSLTIVERLERELEQLKDQKNGND